MTKISELDAASPSPPSLDALVEIETPGPSPGPASQKAEIDEIMAALGADAAREYPYELLDYDDFRFYGSHNGATTYWWTSSMVARYVIGGVPALSAPPATDDRVPIADVSDSGAAKHVTLQTLIDFVIPTYAAAAAVNNAPALEDHFWLTDDTDSVVKMLPFSQWFNIIGALSQVFSPVNGSADRIWYFKDGVGQQWISPDQLASGVHTVFLPAAAFKAQTTNGAASSTIEATTNDVMVAGYAFDASTKEYVQADVLLPKSWDLSDPTVAVQWTTQSGTGGVTWAVAARAFGNDDAIDQAFGTETDLDDTRIADLDFHETPSGTVTIAGTPSSTRRLVKIRVARQVAAANDTKTGDAIFTGLWLTYSTNKRDDS